MVAGIAALLVFILQVRPGWSEWTPAAVAVAGLMAVALGGFVLLALGRSGPGVTSARTDKLIAARYARWRRRLRPFGIAIAIGCLIYAAYIAWGIFRHA